MPTLTTNATRLNNICQGARRARRQVHRRDDSGCRSDITRRGEVGMWGLGRRGGARGHRRRHHRCARCLPRAAAACGLGGHDGAREHRGWNGDTTPSAIAAASEPPPGGFACSLRTHAPVRGAFSRRGAYVCVTRAAAVIVASSDSESPRRFPPRQHGPLVWLGVFACDAARAVVWVGARTVRSAAVLKSPTPIVVIYRV